MSTTKRIIGDYTIDATGNVVIDASGNVNITGLSDVNIAGNLYVSGTTTTVNSTDTEIADRLITLNKGEVGAGVTGVYSGIEVDRGSEDNVALRWNDTSDIWELTLDGTVYEQIATTSVLGAYLENIVEDLTPQLGGDLDVNGASITTAGSNGVTITTGGDDDVTIGTGGAGNISIENGGDGTVSINTGGNGDLTIGTGGTGNVAITTASSGSLTLTTGGNGDVTIGSSGTGLLIVESVASLKDQTSTPTTASGYNKVYSSATQSGGGSGVYFVNTTTSDELVSRTKALAYSLIF